MSENVKREPIVSSAVLGMLIFIFTEIMIFASFMSSFNIIKSSFTNWPPMGQPRLPVAMTAINSLFLLASGILLQLSFRKFRENEISKQVQRFYLLSIILGLIFVLLQGSEWIRLIGFGLTMTSSLYGSFFYLIIGGHALHVLAAATLLIVMYQRLSKKTLQKDSFSAVRVFWFFVVALWPILYGLVYL